jgi:hypothetical protein
MEQNDSHLSILNYINWFSPAYAYPGINSGSSHFTALSYDPQTQVGFLGGTGLRAAGGDLVLTSGCL